jgi:periplasmic divalent cation tolerance protein
MSAVIVLTTLDAATDPAPLARTLVDERLAACVNVLPEMQSTYRWRGAVTVEAERQLVIKTSQDRLVDLQTRLLALHPYEVPEFLVLPVSGGTEAYLTWLREQTAGE